jgi:predicted dithiol-disulfide oxidoreductase (DUF899 family)
MSLPRIASRDEWLAACREGLRLRRLEHLHVRDTSFAYVSRAPLEKVERYKARKGWTFPWYSSYGSDFNYDFGATLDATGYELLPARRR